MISEVFFPELKLLPKTIRDEYKNFKEIVKSSPNSNYISFRATSKRDEKLYTIRVLNIQGDLYKTNKNHSIKLYLQELFYLSASFGRTQSDLESGDEVLFFQKFEVGDDGSMAFVMSNSLSLKEFTLEKDNPKTIPIENFAKQAIADVLFINSRFGITDIEKSLENICSFDTGNELSPLQEGVSSNYFITGWESGKVNTITDESVLRRTTMFEDEIRKSCQDDYLEVEDLKELYPQNDLSAEIYSIGLLALEVAGMPKNVWKDLSKIENQRNYDLILESIIQSLSFEYGQSSSSCSFVSNMLSRENYRRLDEVKQKLLLPEPPTNLHEALTRISQLMHPLYSSKDLHRLIEQLGNNNSLNDKRSLESTYSTPGEDIEEYKSELNEKSILVGGTSLKTTLKKSGPEQIMSEEHSSQLEIVSHDLKDYRTSGLLRKIQVQLLTILEKLFKEKTPTLRSMETEICIQDCFKYIFRHPLIESQTINKTLHLEVKALLNNTNPQGLQGIILSSSKVSDLEAAFIGKCPKWTNLKAILLSNNQITDRGTKEIAENKTWPNLETLDLRGNLITDEGVAKIGLNQCWLSLKQLLLYQNRIGNEGAKKIAANTTWTKLEWLELSNNFISDKGVIAIAANSTWKMLRVLHLYENNIGDQGALGLASNTSWENLIELDLEKNYIGYEGAVAIASNSAWTNLKKCYLSGNSFGEKGISFIHENHSWKNIKDLVLRYECIKPGDYCYLCKIELKETFPHCYSYQKNIYYCYGCVKKEESLMFGIKLGPKKSIDPHALIFIEAASTKMLSNILRARIGDQVNPKAFQQVVNINHHDTFCDACFEMIGLKTRWKCLNCKNVDICDKCYVLSQKKDPQLAVILKIRGHDVESHILQRYLYVEK